MNQSNDELTVCAIVDLLQNLMETVTYEDGIANYQITLQVSMLSFKLIDENIK